MENLCDFDTKDAPFVLYENETPIAYSYGEGWGAMQLWMEGGYPTEKEAVEAYEREQAQSFRSDVQ